MHSGIKGRQPNCKIRQSAGHRNRDIDDRNLYRDGCGPWQDLAQSIKGLGFKNLHATNAQFRQKHHGHNDDPDTAQPLQNTPPKQQTFGQIFQSGKHRRSGCCKPRHGLKERINIAGLGGPKDKGQRAK